MLLHNVCSCIGLQLLLLHFATSLDPVAYLRRYGYLQQQSAGLLRDISGSGGTHDAVLDFQRFVGLPQTGELDAATIQKMEAPRCGNMDRKLQTSKRRKKRYRITDGERWNKNVLSYKIFTYSNMMSRGALETVIDNAFGYWSSVTNVQFFKSSAGHPTQVDIPISFVTGDHGDLTPFDGTGGALAHAFYPRIGDIHFDDEEPWSPINLGSFKKYLLPVAVHEIGHSIGLNHSEVTDAVMAPYYKNYPLLGFRLHRDDINAAQSLFGVKNSGGGTTRQSNGGTYPAGTTNNPPWNTANTNKPHNTGPHHTGGVTPYRPTPYYPYVTYPPWYPSLNAPNYGPTTARGYMPTEGPGNNHNGRPVTGGNWVGTKGAGNTVYMPTKYRPYTYVPTNYQTQGPPQGAGGWNTGRAGGWNTQRAPSGTTRTRSSIDTDTFREWLRRLG